MPAALPVLGVDKPHACLLSAFIKRISEHHLVSGDELYQKMKKSNMMMEVY